MTDPQVRGEATWGTAVATARHALLRVDPAAYALALARADFAGEALLIDWAACGRPLIARRRGACDAPDEVPTGIPLPPSHGKKRIALQLPARAIQSIARPPRLRDAGRAAPDGWRATIEAICDLCLRAGVEPRVFGALAWSSLTGLDYLSASSDLDLLFDAEPDTDVPGLLEGLARIDVAAPMRLDGEVLRLDAGVAANWRELASGCDEVLVKTLDGVALRPARMFLFPDATGLQPWRAAS